MGFYGLLQLRQYSDHQGRARTRSRMAASIVPHSSVGLQTIPTSEYPRTSETLSIRPTPSRSACCRQYRHSSPSRSSYRRPAHAPCRRSLATSPDSRWIIQHAKASCGRQDLLQHLEPFCVEFGDQHAAEAPARAAPKQYVLRRFASTLSDDTNVKRAIREVGLSVDRDTQECDVAYEFRASRDAQARTLTPWLIRPPACGKGAR